MYNQYENKLKKSTGNIIIKQITIFSTYFYTNNDKDKLGTHYVFCDMSFLIIYSITFWLYNSKVSSIVYWIFMS